jgi:hypothetical protein
MRERLNALSLDPSAIVFRKHDVHVAWVACKSRAPVRAIEPPGNPSSINMSKSRTTPAAKSASSDRLLEEADMASASLVNTANNLAIN